jgi:hypothetical protein
MKKIIGIIGIVMLFCIALVAAGSIEDLNYKDKHDSGWGQTDENRQVDDYNVNIDADTVEGVDVVGYINNNELAWLTDTASITNNGGSGLNREDLSEYLTGYKYVFSVYNNFVDYLKNIFVTKAELEAVNLRIDMIEARQNLPERTAAEIDNEALRIGKIRRGEITQKCYEDMCLEVVMK